MLSCLNCWVALCGLFQPRFGALWLGVLLANCFTIQAQEIESAQNTSFLEKDEVDSAGEEDAAELGQDLIGTVTASQVLASMDRGVDFLLGTQNEDGSWGEATRTKNLNIYAPVPGSHHAFRTAVTALCITALCEQESRRPEVAPALDRSQEWLLEKLPQLRRATRDAIYNVWGHGYSISALSALYQRTQDQQLRERIVELIKLQFQCLSNYESVDGGWGYYDFAVGAQRPTASSTSFVNATILVAFHHAANIGVQPPERLLRRAIESTLRQQKPDFSYLYGEYLKYQPMRGINRPGGSLGRSQACNIALLYWGDEKITEEVLVEWLDRLIARHGWLDMGRKRPIPHEAWMQVAGYFFYYGHYYAALCAEQISTDQQKRLAPRLAALLVERQESDGSWWDYPLYNYHPPYGTAFVLMSLHRYHPALREPEDDES